MFGRISRRRILNVLEPNDFDAVTNSRPENEMAFARAMRANVGAPTIPRPRVNVVTLGCITATSATNRINGGKANVVLVVMSKTTSVTPRKYPAASPTAVPTVRARRVAPTATASDT